MNWLKKDCEIYREMISALLDDELSTGDKARLRSHLAHCDDCSALCVAFAAADGALDRAMEDEPATLHRKIMARVQEQARGQRRLRLKRYLKPALITAACLVVISAAVLTPMLMWRSGNSNDSGGTPAGMSGGAAADAMTGGGAPEETGRAGGAEIGGERSGEGAADAGGTQVTSYQKASDGNENAAAPAPAEIPMTKDVASTPAPSPEAEKVLMTLELEVSDVEGTEDGDFTAVVLSDSGGLLSPGIQVTVQSPDTVSASETDSEDDKETENGADASSQSPALQPGDRVMVQYNGLRLIPEGWLVAADSVELIE